MCQLAMKVEGRRAHIQGPAAGAHMSAVPRISWASWASYCLSFLRPRLLILSEERCSSQKTGWPCHRTEHQLWTQVLSLAAGKPVLERPVLVGKENLFYSGSRPPAEMAGSRPKGRLPRAGHAGGFQRGRPGRRERVRVQDKQVPRRSAVSDTPPDGLTGVCHSCFSNVVRPCLPGESGPSRSGPVVCRSQGK